MNSVPGNFTDTAFNNIEEEKCFISRKTLAS